MLALSVAGAEFLNNYFALDVEWERSIGGSREDYVRAIQPLDDGYLLAGGTRSYGLGKSDIYLIKLYDNGKLAWEKTYGSAKSEYARDLLVVDDGYVIVGDRRDRDTYWDVLLVKTDLAGNFLWEREFGGVMGDEGRSIQQTSDGGYILGGETESFSASKDIYLIKTNSRGRMQWSKTYGGPGYERTRSLIIDSDGNYVLTGRTSSIGAGGYDVLLMKITPGGTMLWMKAFGGRATDWGYCVREAADGGYIIAGRTRSWSADFSTDVYVVKTDHDGELEWENTYGGSRNDQAFTVSVQPNDVYLVAGSTTTSGLDQDVYLLRLSSKGKVFWTKTVGSQKNEVIFCMDAHRHDYTLAGHILTTDDTTKDAYIIKIREYT